MVQKDKGAYIIFAIAILAYALSGFLIVLLSPARTGDFFMVYSFAVNPLYKVASMFAATPIWISYVWPLCMVALGIIVAAKSKN